VFCEGRVFQKSSGIFNKSIAFLVVFLSKKQAKTNQKIDKNAVGNKS